MSDCENELDSDHEISKDHSKLLDAVSKLDKSQRVLHPERSEPSLQVSEFHLVTSGATSAPVPLSLLLQPLSSHPSHRPLTQKLKSLQTRSQVLPKPLERPQAEALKRQIGFSNTKKEIQKWDAVITRNRTAPLSFPLPHGSISVKGTSTDEFLKRFRVKSDLEKELEALEPPKPVPEPEDEFPLTLGEILEKRSEAARIRAQQSYKVAKAHRQKKIKSKKFHRIARKAKIKQQLKEFEDLQKTDPEAALEKLEQLDKTRAEERMSLRHRSTGQWAKNKQVRAKYDTESRKVLAQQLSISRELTQKVRKGESDDDSDQELQEDPWTKTTGEIEEFVSNYRKFWDEKNKQSQGTDKTNGTSGSTENSQDAAGTVPGPNAVGTVREPTEENEVQTIKHVKSSKKLAKKIPKRLNPVEEVYEGDEKIFDVENVDLQKKKKSAKNQKTEASILPKFSPENSKKGGKTKEVSELNRSMDFEIEEVDFNGRTIEVKKSDVKFTSEWAVEVFPKVSSSGNLDSTLDIDDLFDKAEAKLRKTVAKKARKVKQKIRKLGKYEETENNEDSEEEYADLSFKKAKNRVEIDETLDENSEKIAGNDSGRTSGKDLRNGSGNDFGKSSGNDLRNGSGKDFGNSSGNDFGTSSGNDFGKSSGEKRKAEIDPEKFVKVKPKHLKTQIPDNVEGGDEAMDDSDEDEVQRGIISEAFADDDVVEEFRKEKENEMKKSEPEDLDLRLPGWGSWTGKDLKQSLRKKRRFIVKFPKEAPRKDENKGDVIIVEDANTQIKQHLVAELPYPFTSVSEYEASIRAPIGREFVPEHAHKRLTDRNVETKMGSIIEPMDEDVLAAKKGGMGGFPQVDKEEVRKLAGKRTVGKKGKGREKKGKKGGRV